MWEVLNTDLQNPKKLVLNKGMSNAYLFHKEQCFHTEKPSWITHVHTQRQDSHQETPQRTNIPLTYKTN